MPAKREVGTGVERPLLGSAAAVTNLESNVPESGTAPEQ
jgi:hypothetical protein